MDQRKYIMTAILMIVAGILIYICVKKFTPKTIVENSSRIIDYDDTVDSINKSRTEGKLLYIDKCASCHGGFGKADGPGLLFDGMESRWPDKKELFAFIRNPEEVMKRNVYARELKGRFGAAMLGFPSLTDKEIQSILDYINKEEKAPKTIY